MAISEQGYACSSLKHSTKIILCLLFIPIPKPLILPKTQAPT